MLRRQLTVKTINGHASSLWCLVADYAITSWTTSLLVTTDPHSRLSSGIQLKHTNETTDHRSLLPVVKGVC